MINVFSSSRYKVNKKKILQKVKEDFLNPNFFDENNINIVFIGKRKMKSIALKYKEEDVALPVLAFSYLKDKEPIINENEEKIIGEVFICYPQAVLLAAERNKTVDNMMVELIVHGIKNIFK